MATTVGTFLTRIATDLHELDNTFPSGLWKQEEMIGFINNAELDFQRRTMVYQAVETTVTSQAYVRLYDYPDTISDISRLSHDTKRLFPATTWDLDREDSKWRTRVGRPKQYHTDHLPVHQFELDKAPNRNGSFHFIGPASLTELTLTTDNLNLPDEWEPYIRWEVLSLALGKDGDNQDIVRAEYSHKRYLLGVALAIRLMTGRALDLREI